MCPLILFAQHYGHRWSHSLASSAKLATGFFLPPPALHSYPRYNSIVNHWLTLQCVSSVQSVMSNSLWSHEPQHARLPCPSPIQEFIQTHVRQVDDAIQPSHPLSSPSPPAFNLSKHQGLFQWVSSSHPCGQSIGASASVCSMNIQDWFPLGLTGLTPLQSKGLSRVFSNTTVQKHQFFSTQLSL